MADQTTPECAVCHTTGYWVGWLPKASEYRCINHNKTYEEVLPTERTVPVLYEGR